LRRARRHGRPRVFARSAQGGAEPGGGIDPCARAFLDADLFADGDRAGASSGGPVPGGQPMNTHTPPRILAAAALVTPRNLAVAAVIAMLLLLPVYAHGVRNLFLLSLFTRIVILAMAAVSLNLIMGFGGMVSFGHAAYIGIGAYVVGI